MDITDNNKRFILMLSSLGSLLLIPLIAMYYTDEVNWNGFDFLMAGLLLLGTGVLIEFTLRKVKSKQQRILIIVVLLLFLFLLWAEMAVGIFGSAISGS